MPGGAGIAVNTKDRPWLEWEKNYSIHKEWDHVIGWEGYGHEATFGVFEEFHGYVKLSNDIENYNGLNVKCKVCRNARGQAILFDEGHSKSESHITAVRNRTKAIETAKQLNLEEKSNINLVDVWEVQQAIRNGDVNSDKLDLNSYNVLSKYDECYKWAWVPTIRCKLCGDQHDMDFDFDDWKQQVKGHTTTKRHQSMMTGVDPDDLYAKGGKGAGKGKGGGKGKKW